MITHMTIRDNLARTFSGGPEFRIRPEKLLIEVDNGNPVSELVDKTPEEIKQAFDGKLIPEDDVFGLRTKLEDIGFNVKQLDNIGMLVAELDSIDDIVGNITQTSGMFSREAIQTLREAREKAVRSSERTTVGLGIFSGMEFGEDLSVSREAKIRRSFTSLDMHNPLTDALEDLDGVLNVEMTFTKNTFGPRNLNVDILSRPSVNDLLNEDKDTSGLTTLADSNEKLNMPEAWEYNRGEGAVVAIFDTSFSSKFLESDRVLDTFSGEDVDSVYSSPEEGHGTMTAYAAAGDKGTSGLEYDGMAPESDLLLIRTTDSSGALTYTEEGWDWLVGKIRELDRPVISNHSYGVPLCSAVGMNSCESSTADLVRSMNKRDDHQAFYAAGNEATYCGHRLSGITNGISGINSDPTCITVAALRFDLLDAQTYSSHGFGTCSSRDEDPKPDVGCLLPSLIPYGSEVKDMSSGQGGSSGGTSLASPMTCGLAALIASETGTAKTDELQDILESTANQVRTTQVNAVTGYDARFGRGQIDPVAALEKATQ